MDELAATRVLLVDTSPWVSQTSAIALNSRGYAATWAMSAADAARILRHVGVDVLVVHGHFPRGYDPYQFALEAAFTYPRLAIVAVSSDVEDEDLFIPPRASLLIKPFDLAQLEGAIADACVLARIAALIEQADA
jgi:DNA-binding response OmpR family regulator